MVTLSVLEADLLGYVGAALAYLMLTALAVGWWKRDLGGLMLIAACLITATWAAVTCLELWRGTFSGELVQIIDACRSAVWILLPFSLFSWVAPPQRLRWAVVLAAATVCVAGSGPLLAGLAAAEKADWPQQIFFSAQLALALTGLAVTENLFRNSPRQRRWALKYLCFGAGAIFAFDFFVYADAFLFHRIDVDLFLSRGLVALLAVPFFGIFAKRNRKAGPLVAVSRQFVFYSTTFIVAGIYLLVMTIAGYYIRRFGGNWSTFLQVLFLFGAIFLLLIPIASGTVRANLRVLLEKHLFAYRYDYRREWIRFTQTISDREAGGELRIRVIQAIADIVGSPEGGLWLPGVREEFSLAAVWNFSRWNLTANDSVLSGDAEFLRFLERTKWVIDLNEYARRPDLYDGIGTLPPWLLGHSRAWLLVPLFLHEQLVGFVVLGQALADRTLSWEDFDILKTVGQQAASYLAQQRSDEALAEARQFESFNKRFAFVAHDIKNLVSQLSLLLANSEKHGAKPAFQSAMVETVRQSVLKLNGMLDQLNAASPPQRTPKAIELGELLRDIVDQRPAASSVLLRLDTRSAELTADEERLKAAFGHLLQNAIDAVGDSGHVDVRLGITEGKALVEIADDGPGMDQAFVRDRLFRPFDSTKTTGYGIGMYQSREYIQALGGRIDVDSAPGRGTTMRVTIPVSRQASAH